MSSRLRARAALWLTLTGLPIAISGILLLTIGTDGLGGARPLLVVLVALALVGLLVGWFGLLAPMLGRIERTATIAARVADGLAGSDRLADRLPDEVGELARTVDRLAGERDSDQRLRAEAADRLAHQSERDPLTGAFNRQRMSESIDQALAEGHDVSLVSVDLDDFALINETWGYSVGDEVLHSVANQLRQILGESTEFARWSGDAFLVMLIDVDPAGRTDLVARIRSRFDEAITTTAATVPLAATVVAATAGAGDDRPTSDDLLRSVEEARGTEKATRQRARALDPATADLVELALTQDRLEVWFQPIVEFASTERTQMVGAEAFLRVRDDDGSLRLPDDFLGEIMTSAYARDIDDRMARLAIANLAAWRTDRLVPNRFLLALNLSPASLHDPDLGSRLVDICGTGAIEPDTVVLDVSEEAGELDQILAAELRQLGFRLSIDDLGFKRSNFDRLFAIGAEFAKLHRRWLDDPVMLEALVTVCQRKGLGVIAEGIETRAQLEQLVAHGVRLGQGYLISRPLSAPDFTALLNSGAR